MSWAACGSSAIRISPQLLGKVLDVQRRMAYSAFASTNRCPYGCASPESPPPVQSGSRWLPLSPGSHGRRAQAARPEGYARLPHGVGRGQPGSRGARLHAALQTSFATSPSARLPFGARAATLGFADATWEEAHPVYVTVYPQVVSCCTNWACPRSPFGVLPVPAALRRPEPHERRARLYGGRQPAPHSLEGKRARGQAAGARSSSPPFH